MKESLKTGCHILFAVFFIGILLALVASPAAQPQNLQASNVLYYAPGYHDLSAQGPIALTTLYQ